MDIYATEHGFEPLAIISGEVPRQSYLRFPRVTREDTVYEVLGTVASFEWIGCVKRERSAIWTRTVSGYGHVGDGRFRVWTETELQVSSIHADPIQRRHPL